MRTDQISQNPGAPLRIGAVVLAMTGAAALAAHAAGDWLDPQSLALFFVVPVLVAAIRFGFLASLCAALLISSYSLSGAEADKAVPQTEAEKPKSEVATNKPPTGPEIEKAIQRGIDFLVGRQNKDGSWGSARRTKDLNIFAPAPTVPSPANT